MAFSILNPIRRLIEPIATWWLERKIDKQYPTDWSFIPYPNFRLDVMNSGVLRDVPIVGIYSFNYRYYLPDALQRAAILFEHAPVYIDHIHDAKKLEAGYKRDKTQYVGIISNVRFVDFVGLIADFHFPDQRIPLKMLFQRMMQSGHHIGFSLTVAAQYIQTKKYSVITNITQVYSVDLVPQPASRFVIF